MLSDLQRHWKNSYSGITKANSPIGMCQTEQDKGPTAIFGDLKLQTCDALRSAAPREEQLL